MTDSAQTPDVPLLDAVQARLLGCLVEKEATTPDTYPLTVNAAQSAANQKTAREPVMNVDAGSVQHALRQLEALGLARQHFSSRADRYEHRLQAALDLTRQQTVLLALLLLRGPQTLGELVTRRAPAPLRRHRRSPPCHRAPAAACPAGGAAACQWPARRPLHAPAVR